MASLFDLTKGQAREFDRVLAAAGFNKEMAEEIITIPLRAKQIVHLLCDTGFMNLLADLVGGMFPRPEVQLENLRRWNADPRINFGFSDKHFDIGDPPDWPDSEDGQKVVVATPYLATPVETLLELSQVVCTQQRHTFSFIRNSEEYLVEFDRMPAERPCIVWDTIDLSPVSQQTTDSSVSYPGASVLALAAHAPFWFRSLKTAVTIRGVSVTNIHRPASNLDAIRPEIRSNIELKCFDRHECGIRRAPLNPERVAQVPVFA